MVVNFLKYNEMPGDYREKKRRESNKRPPFSYSTGCECFSKKAAKFNSFQFVYFIVKFNFVFKFTRLIKVRLDNLFMVNCFCGLKKRQKSLILS